MENVFIFVSKLCHLRAIPFARRIVRGLVSGHTSCDVQRILLMGFLSFGVFGFGNRKQERRECVRYLSRSRTLNLLFCLSCVPLARFAECLPACLPSLYVVFLKVCKISDLMACLVTARGFRLCACTVERTPRPEYPTLYDKRERGVDRRSGVHVGVNHVLPILGFDSF